MRSSFCPEAIKSFCWVVSWTLQSASSILRYALEPALCSDAFHCAAWITAIVATIPCLSPCILIGMPIGIWIILLSKPEVQAEFQAATRN